ncbi:tetratricopeptide repeat-containing sensor histidine kinase [Ferruginibacter sp.]|nr:tetratricopeptide repeat protein [Ferruginibacter sp.]
MIKPLSVLLAVLLYYNGYAQTSRTDSINGLIVATTDINEKARLFILRSKAWPNSQTEKPLADAQQALAYYQQSKNEEGQVDGYLQLSGIYSRQNKYKLALDFDSVAYNLANTTNYKKGKALALGLMGRNHQQLGNLKLAEEKNLQSLQLLKEAGLENEMAETHNRLGVIYRRLSDIKKSLYHFEEGITLAQSFKNDAVLAVLYMNKANSLNEAARYDEAVGMHLKSIRIKEKLKDERGLLQSFNNIAIVFMRTQQYETSLDYFRKANLLAKQFNNKTSLGYNYVNMAGLFNVLNKKDSVPALYELSLAAFKATEEKTGVGLVYHNYGNFLLEQQQLDKAEEMLLKALDIRKQTKSLYDIASTMNVMGSLLTQKGKTKEAEDLLLQSLAMLKDENSVRQKDAYKHLAEHYKATGNYEEAYKYQAGYITMSDTLADENEVTTMLRTQSQYEVEKRDAQLELAKKDKALQYLSVSKKNQQLVYLGIALVLALLLCGVFYFIYRNKKQHAVVLENKNSQIETLIRELHHRVKNNLQVVSGLLSLQSSRMEDDKARQAMDEGRTRVDAMAMIHQKLYMDKDLAGVDIKDYLENLTSSLAGSFGYNKQHIETSVAMQQPSLDIDMAIPIGLIVNELVTNAFKHAFSSTAQPKIKISLIRNEDGSMDLNVADNGSGILTDTDTSKSFGMKLVHTLVTQLNGSIQQQHNNGTIYSIQIRA